MPTLARPRTAALLLALAPAAGAQLPPGHAAVFRTPLSVGEALTVVEPDAGASYAVDLTSPTPAARVALDPITGDFFATSVFVGDLLRVEFDDAASASGTLFGQVSTSGALLDVALGGNGHIFATSGQGEVFRFDRTTGVGELCADLALPGAFLMGSDVATSRMWIAHSQSVPGIVRVFELDTSLSPLLPELLFEVPLSPLSGLDYDSKRDALHMVTSLSNQLVRYDLEAQTLVFLDSGALPAASSFVLDYDRARDLVHLAGNAIGQGVYATYDPRLETLELVPASVAAAPSALVVNDLIDTTAIFPHRPSAGQAFTLEVAAHGHEGDLAAVFALSLNGQPVGPIVLAAGVCDAGGFLSGSFQVSTSLLDAGDTVGFVSARLSQVTGNVVFGAAASMEVQP